MQDPPQKLIVGIDAGYRNFAVCVLDANSGKLQSWSVSDLVPHIKGKPTVAQIGAGVHMWLEQSRKLLERTSFIMLETQMRKPFMVMNALIMGFCIALRVPTMELHPKTMAKHFGLRQKREDKKADGIALITKMWGKDAFPDHHKLDDLADSALLALAAYNFQQQQ